MQTAPLRLLLLTAGCGLAVGLTGQAVRAEFVPRVYEARRVTTAPVLDGDLTDAVWQTAQPITDVLRLSRPEGMSRPRPPQRGCCGTTLTCTSGWK